MNTVIIIEDKNEDIEFIRRELTNTPSWLLLNSYGSVEECINNTAFSKQPKFILLDIYLNGSVSIDRIFALKKAFPSSIIIMYTNCEKYDLLIRSFQNGALGYFIKTNNRDRFHSQLKILEQDGSIISPLMARAIAIKVRQNKIRFKSSNKLSEKDLHTLQLLAKGRTYKQIAELEHMTVEGVRSRIRRIYHKLNVANRWEAINKLKKWYNI